MGIKIGNIPTDLSDQLAVEFLDIKKRYLTRDWGPGQLKGGRFAEVILRVFQHLLGEQITPFGVEIKAPEKTDILNKIQSHPTLDKHVRMKVSSLTRLLLDFRNDRDAGHLGGFDANSMDALFVTTAATWALCEMVRVYSGYPMPEAQKLVDSLAVRDYPAVLEFEGETFITRHDLTAKQAVLVLLSKHQKKTRDFLFEKAGDSNSSRFEKKLGELLSGKFIGEKNGEYFLLPRGIKAVDEESLLQYP